jgi:hypothetical protein
MQRILYVVLWIGMSLAWASWTIGIAEADPPQYCRDLAMQFGTDPTQLDANALAALGTCVMAEIKERSDAPSQTAPSEQQQESPGNTPIDQPGWGQWSTPPPWSDSWAKPQPWEDK